MTFDEGQGYVVLATIAVPLLAALVLVFTPGQQKMLVRYISAVTGAIVAGLSIYIFAAYQLDGSDAQMRLQWVWVENTAFLGKDGITLNLAVDGISALMALLTGIVAFAGALASWKLDFRNKDFYILYWTLLAGVYGTFFSYDLFFFFFFYELAVMPLYLLIGVWGSTRKEYGAAKLTLMLVGGSVLIWIGIFAVFHEANLGTFDMEQLWAAGRDGTLSPTFQKVFFPFMVVGCGVLAALWPFHTWSPDGHMAAPTAVSMVHAGVLMKLGAFGIIRLGIQMMPAGAEFWMPTLMVLGVIGAVYGATAALTQRDFKLISGYSSVSHMGYVLMGLATMNQIGVTGAVLQMFSHGVMTALVFLMIGALYDQAHTRDLKDFGGITKVMPLWVIFYSIAGLANVGLPGFSGFTAEFHIFVGTFRSYPVFGALAIFAAALAAAYMLRLFAIVFFGPFDVRWSDLKDLTPLERLSGGMLIASIVIMGVWWAPFTDRVGQTVTLLPGVTG
ncbi:MAG: NADH-quinone oxidoreductase subunit M [Chloroflexi bacterium]|nr:NADH-quinone oxidoreductase subunit M [Dehalococcoidia bacterium]MCO5201983.1 NADH-quinone oxidoreductase subunit M [Chloroflexota bacterium]MCZ7577821.1 NADH-quinone oxidoreductase subunit M [Dehalococcoidia bacterium]NJD63926.1 NADH-quinone oxidoreductase subunit M [Chloroflexota bacterium]PWB69330.1 MAG: NADH-quinone oxidoreductase subunit M [Holophagae bacterium]